MRDAAGEVRCLRPVQEPARSGRREAEGGTELTCVQRAVGEEVERPQRPDVRRLEAREQAVAGAIDIATGGATETTTRPQAADAVLDVGGGALTAIVGLTVAIAGLVVTLFFALLTLERAALFGVLKAVGARTRTLFAGTLAQAASLAVTGFSPGRLTAFRQTNVGFVFQSVNLIPFLTAQENLLVVDELGPRRSKQARARADELLGQLGLTDRARNLPGELSGGQRQRVAIGRALMNDPALVLLDEPTSALGTATGSQVMDLIREETKAHGTAAVVVVTHDARIPDWCDRTVQISDGRIARQPVLAGAATPG